MTFRLERVSFTYDQRSTSSTLSDLTCTFPSGHAIAVLGLSGSGKTTLLNLLGLLANPVDHRGDVTYQTSDGQELLYRNLNSAAAAQLRRDEFGFVLQSAYMLPHFTCGQNVGMPLALSGLSAAEIDQRVVELMQRADPTGKLLTLKDRLARNVSGGEKQRMAVLRAIVHNPHLLFADEPLSSLDPRNAELIMDLIGRWRRGELQSDSQGARTLVLVTHDVEIAWRECEYFAIMHGGQLTGGKLWKKEELEGVPQIKQFMMGPASEGASAIATTLKVPGFKTLSGFLNWFAYQNLWERSARRTTWINLISLAVIVGFVLLTFGLTKGFEQSRLNALRDDPLNLCFWIEGSGTEEGRITSSQVQDLDASIRESLSARDYLGVYPFYETRYRWLGNPAAARPINIAFTGRTLSERDPVLKSVRFVSPSTSVSLEPEDEAVIVSSQMLRDLEYPAGTFPDTLYFESADGQPVIINVMAVAEKLPLGHNFIVTERQEARMRVGYGNQIKDTVRLGPIPQSWQNAKASPDFTRMLDDYQLAAPLDEDRDSQTHWIMTSNTEPLSVSRWRGLTDQLIAQLENLTGTNRPQKRMLDPGHVEVPEYQPPADYDYAGVYCLSLDALTPANKICQKFNLSGNDEVLSQLQSIGRETSALMALLGLIGAVIAGVVSLNMILVQILRSERQVAEFGMLKAMGMRHVDMGKVALTEAAQLWIFGTLLGVLFVMIVGPLFAMALQLSGITIQFAWPWRAFMIATVGSLLICLLSNYWATRRSRRQPASTSLRTN